MPNAVIVIDMVRGFLESPYPLYCGERSRKIIKPVQELLREELAKGSKIFYLCDNHDVDDYEFSMFPRHCVVGSIESQVIPELSSFPGEMIPKKRYSCFFKTPLSLKLEALKPEKLILCGVCTDICVLFTAADCRNYEYTTEVPVDCVASFNEIAHAFALEHMKNVLGVTLTHRPQEKPYPFLPSPAVVSGETADIYFARTVEILAKEGRNPVATMEVFPGRDGLLCGMKEVKALLEKVLPAGSQVWGLPEGTVIKRKEVVLRITAPYQSYGLYETSYLGILSQCTGWATAARECVEAARGIPIISFGARHVHPSVAGYMDYSAIVGGCAGCSSVIGARMSGTVPMGTMPHALIITMGDTVKATLAFDKHMPPEVPRISLVDTFKDEPEESLLVARALQGRLQGVRLDTPTERGRVTIDLVKEVRAHLDLAGFKEVKITVSGGLDPARMRSFLDAGAPVDMFGVGSYISGAAPIDFTADLHEIDGRPVAKRGRLPGITPNPRLQRIM